MVANDIIKETLIKESKQKKTKIAFENENDKGDVNEVSKDEIMARD